MDDELLNTVESYCERRGIAEATLSRLACNNSTVVKRLREKGNVTYRTAQTLRKYMRDNPPKNGAE